MGLKVQALAGGVGGDQDADGMLAGSALKARLISSRCLGRRRAVEDGDPLVGPVGAFDGGRELLVQVALRVVVLGEDDDAGVVPVGGLRRIACPASAGPGTCSRESSRPA